MVSYHMEIKDPSPAVRESKIWTKIKKIPIFRHFLP